MDFFSAVHHGVHAAAPTDHNDVAVFANAVADRAGSDMLRARLTMSPVPESPMAKMSLSPPAFTPVVASALSQYLDDPHTLIVDIRPHAAYTDARLPRALSLSVPSTLLKRPLFSLDRLAAMLPSPSDRTRFSTFRESARILVYDADANTIPESSNIHGLLRKFKAAAYPGELTWLRGGFQAVWRQQRHLVDSGLQPEERDDDDDSGPVAPSSSILRTKHLPISAFSLSSTTSKRRPQQSQPMPASQPITRPTTNPFFDTIRQNIELSHGITERIPLRLPARVRRRIADLPFPWLQEIAKRAARAPPRIHHPHRPSTHPLHPPTSSSDSSSSFSDSSDSDAGPSPAFVEEGTEALAMQFYRIELAEQRRLMGVMEHHSKESGRFVVNDVFEQTHASLVFPFSITAGVEKGAKNRYRHIWPFEHARVRLHTPGRENTHKQVMEEDDYVNASYVQPLGTNRRYIATQGPLDATFDDFWRLTWEQNVHVIVMLTQEIEGSMVKCGAYWADTKHPAPERTFGPLRLTLVSKVGLPSGVDLLHEDSESAHAPTPAGFAFPAAGLNPHHTSRRRRVTTIKRTFALTHAGYPHLGARTVVQLQYLDWPDMNVPDDARGVLELVREVERAVKETDGCVSPVPVSPGMEKENGRKEMRMDPGSGIARHALEECRPVLLHCSAGVGRTGGFITVDAVLDAVRREMRRKKEVEAEEAAKRMERGGAVAMDVDGASSVVSSVVAADGQDNGGLVTVPLHVTGNTALGTDAGGGSGVQERLVLHVPAVVVPTSAPISTPLPPTADVSLPITEGAGARTPMQVDIDEYSPSMDSEEMEVRPTVLTRKWAERVSDSYSAAGTSGAVPVPGTHPHPRPQAFPSTSTGKSTSSASTSSVSASTFPSLSDPEDSPRANRIVGGSGSAAGYRESSSLGTSVSGASVGSDKEREKELQVLREKQAQALAAQQHGQGQRFRTFSAPQQAQGRTKVSFSLGLGVGSSPLARSSGEQQQQVEAQSDAMPRVHASQSISHPHPSPPLSPPTDPSFLGRSPSSYVPDSHVSSGFAERPATTVDYKEPRALHGVLETPVALGGFEEPIWEVVQDMREQRMSLCQSLRQYVFVHAAIIEGALWIVDEQREKERERKSAVAGLAEEEQRKREVESGRLSVSSSHTASFGSSITHPYSHSHQQLASSSSSSRTSRSSLPSFSLPPILPLHTFNSTSSGVASDSGSILSTGKRGASPTELLKEGKKGEVLLSKRPSIKRKVQMPSPGGETETKAVSPLPQVLGIVPPSPMALQ